MTYNNENYLRYRRYTQDSNSSYYHEKYYSNHHEPTPELPGWDNNTVGDDGEHAIPIHLFPKHTTELHMDQVIIKCFAYITSILLFFMLF